MADLTDGSLSLVVTHRYYIKFSMYSGKIFGLVCPKNAQNANQFTVKNCALCVFLDKQISFEL